MSALHSSTDKAELRKLTLNKLMVLAQKNLGTLGTSSPKDQDITTQKGKTVSTLCVEVFHPFSLSSLGLVRSEKILTIFKGVNRLLSYDEWTRLSMTDRNGIMNALVDMIAQHNITFRQDT